MAKKKTPSLAALIISNPLAHLERLDDELLLAILEYLDTIDVARVRITNTAFTPCCNSIFAARLKRLYILPTLPSLKRAHRVANHPVFRDKIEEVVLLGEQPLRELEKLSYPPRSDMGPGYYHYTRKSLARQFAPWPSAKEIQAHRLVAQSSSLPDMPAWAQNAAQPISDILGRLPTLKKLKLLSVDDLSHPGWNPKPQAAISAHAKKYLDIPEPKTSLTGNDKLGRKEDDNFRNTDAEVLFTALFVTTTNLTELELDTELPYVTSIIWSLRVRNRFSTLAKSKLDALKTVRLTLDSGWNRTDWHILCSTVLAFCSNLEVLKLSLKANTAPKRGTVGRTLFDLLQGLQFERLHTLDIRMIPFESAESKLQRPQCEEFNMGAFLRLHRESLKVVHFDNVFFARQHERPADTMRKLLHRVWRHEDELKASFTWTINSYTHSLKCKQKGNSIRHCGSLSCFRYDADGIPDLTYVTTWEDMVSLMRRLGHKTAGDGNDLVWELGVLMRGVGEEWIDE